MGVVLMQACALQNENKTTKISFGGLERNFNSMNVSRYTVNIPQVSCPLHHLLPGKLDHKALRFSEDPDIDIRGKDQKARIKKLCQIHFFPGEQSFPTNKKDFYSHLLFSDEQRVLFCYVPKVGCTNMKRLVFYMSGNLPLDTVNKSMIDHEEYLFPAQQIASLANVTLTTKEKEERLFNYYKFMIVRNPLERLLSAYRDKIEYPLLSFGIPENSFPEIVKSYILSRYRPTELRNWRVLRYVQPFNISVTFPEFISYLTETDHLGWNEHFLFSMDICHPCLVQYDFYGNFRNYSTDASRLIEKFKTNPKFYQNKSFHKSQDETRTMLQKYYKQLNDQLKNKLFRILYNELLFYYTLYPSERNSHQELLGIDTPVLIVS